MFGWHHYYPVKLSVIDNQTGAAPAAAVALGLAHQHPPAQNASTPQVEQFYHINSFELI